MGCFQPDAPATPNYGQVTQQTLAAQGNVAPSQFNLEAQYQPLYSNLMGANLEALLNGSAGGPQTTQNTTTAMQNGWYDSTGKLVSTSGANAPAPAGAKFYKKNEQFTSSNTVNVPGSVGLLKLLNQQNESQRVADINDVATLGPQAREAMLAANPDNAALLSKLNAQANSELDAGSNLTPDQQRAMQQQSRAAFAARGMGGSNGAIADELLKQFNLGQQLLQQRQQFAQSVLANNQAVIGDPFQMILGRSSGAVPMAQSGLSQAGPSLFNPQAGLGLAQSNYQTQANFAAATPTTFQNILMGLNTMNNGIAAARGGSV